jgi:hypothetical protein
MPKPRAMRVDPRRTHVRTRLSIATVLALAATGLVPLPAGAAISGVTIGGPAGPVCIDASGSSAVTVAVRRGSSTLESATVASPSSATLACDNSAGSRFVPAVAHPSLAGTTIVASQGAQSVSAPVPAAAYDAAGGPGAVRLDGLPSPADLSGSGWSASAVAGGSYATGTVATPSAAVHVAAALGGGVAYGATLTPAQFHFTSSDGAVHAYGLDSAGLPAVVTAFAADGTVLDRVALVPRAGFGQDATATLGVAGVSGGSIDVSQPGWFDHTAAVGSASFTDDGFSVAAPADAAAGSGYSYTQRFLDPAAVAALPATDPLRCLALGPSVGCAGGSTRLAATVSGRFAAAGDSLSLLVVHADGDSVQTTVRKPGAIGSLDDGSLDVFGDPDGPVSARISSPRAAPLPPLARTVATSTLDDGTAHIGGPGRPSFRLHVNDGATVALSGAGIGTVPTGYAYDLSAGLDGSVLSGSTYPLAQIVVRHTIGSTTTVSRLVADLAGGFSIDLGDVLPPDAVEVDAADPASHSLTVGRLVAGEADPQISGLGDQQLVRGRIAPTLSPSPAGGAVWGGDLPFLRTTVAPFADALDTTRLDDGSYRIEGRALPGPSRTAYLYVTVDNTPPSGGAGPDQLVPRGRAVAFVTAAADANGLASVRIAFGDGTSTNQPFAQLGRPITHAYRKLRRYVATATITDRAGNVTSDTAAIRVVRGLPAAVIGSVPGVVRRGHDLRARLSPRAPGQLSLQVLTRGNALVVDGSLGMPAARHAYALRLATHRLRAGRYTLVMQFVDGNGIAGPVVVRTLVVR